MQPWKLYGNGLPVFLLLCRSRQYKPPRYLICIKCFLIRWVQSFFVVFLVERGSAPTLAWSWSLSLRYCFWMSPPLDWMLTLLCLSSSCWRSKYYTNLVIDWGSVKFPTDWYTHLISAVSLMFRSYDIAMTLLMALSILYHYNEITCTARGLYEYKIERKNSRSK